MVNFEFWVFNLFISGFKKVFSDNIEMPLFEDEIFSQTFNFYPSYLLQQMCQENEH